MKSSHLNKVLSFCLHQSFYLFRQKTKPFVIVFLTCILSTSVFSQQRSITGKITNGDSALVGVTVSEKNTANATRTNEEGMYTIQVNPEATLVFSFVGFEAQEIKVNNQSV